MNDTADDPFARLRAMQAEYNERALRTLSSTRAMGVLYAVAQRSHDPGIMDAYLAKCREVAEDLMATGSSLLTYTNHAQAMCAEADELDDLDQLEEDDDA